jgi:hypothetical protein
MTLEHFPIENREGTDLQTEIWHCLRLWLFDYCYFNPETNPFRPTLGYGPSPRTFHALSYWKAWMARKPELADVALEARYKYVVDDDEGRPSVTMVRHPDGGEVTSATGGGHDYLLRQPGYPQPEVLCAVESEQGKKVGHVTEDLPKLIAVRSPLKVMLYRMNCSKPRKTPPKPQLVEAGFAERKQAIEAAIADNPAAYQAREDWLFIGWPYLYPPYPRRPEGTFVRLYTLSTPCKSVSLVEPDWDIWQFPHEMDRWIRSLGGDTSASSCPRD